MYADPTHLPHAGASKSFFQKRPISWATQRFSSVLQQDNSSLIAENRPIPEIDPSIIDYLENRLSQYAKLQACELGEVPHL